jgi:hypothetical protein
LRERDHFEDIRLDGRIIFRWIFKKWDGVMDWIDVAQDVDKWRSFVNMVGTFGFCKMRGMSSLDQGL